MTELTWRSDCEFGGYYGKFEFVEQRVVENRREYGFERDVSRVTISRLGCDREEELMRKGEE